MILEIPAVRGIQAGREYYIAMWPLANIGMFRFSDAALEPELRAQRHLNRGRIPEMARYVVENRESYVFSALTASIDGEIRFVGGEASDIGVLRVPSASRIVI